MYVIDDPKDRLAKHRCVAGSQPTIQAKPSVPDSAIARPIGIPEKIRAKTSAKIAAAMAISVIRLMRVAFGRCRIAENIQDAGYRRDRP